MKKKYNKFVTAVVLLVVLCGYFCMFKEQRDFAILPIETTTESFLLVTKPYPLNDWDYVENPGGYFPDEEYLDFTTERVTEVTQCNPSVVEKPLTEKPVKVETESTTIIEETSSAAEGPSEGIIEETTTQKPAPQYIIKASHYAVAAEDIYYTSPIRTYTEEQKTLIAQMLYCESGGEGWDCQVATCSAIINFIEHYGGDFSVLDNGNKFSPASYYRYKTPTNMNWKVLDYVLNGHLIANVKYFQLYGYHSFGTPMFCVGGVYFSK